MSVTPMVCFTTACWLLSGRSSCVDCALHSVTANNRHEIRRGKRSLYMEHSSFAKRFGCGSTPEVPMHPTDVARRLDASALGLVSGRVTKASARAMDAQRRG